MLQYSLKVVPTTAKVLCMSSVNVCEHPTRHPPAQYYNSARKLFSTVDGCVAFTPMISCSLGQNAWAFT